MSATARRSRALSWHRAARRALAVALCLALAAGAWRVVRPVVVDRVARESLGWSIRGQLVWEALRARYAAEVYDFARSLRSWRPDALYSYDDPSRGAAGVVWSLHESAGVWGSDPTVAVVADGGLKVRGFVASDAAQWLDAADYDRDGRLEMIVGAHDPDAEDHEQSRIAVVRLRGGTSELLAICAFASPGTSRRWLSAVWEPDPNLAGAQRLRLSFVRRTGGTVTVDPPVAALAFTARGGVMQLIESTDPDDLRGWSPPDGKPVVFPSRQHVGELARALWPKSGRHTSIDGRWTSEDRRLTLEIGGGDVRWIERNAAGETLIRQFAANTASGQFRLERPYDEESLAFYGVPEPLRRAILARPPPPSYLIATRRSGARPTGDGRLHLRAVLGRWPADVDPRGLSVPPGEMPGGAPSSGMSPGAGSSEMLIEIHALHAEPPPPGAGGER
ncbi:MAG: hypothetical protein LC135_11130 [Phycisphaerae bacterium]|nr:hypothetical protein [Phycisphaerae bacterium]MCZ2400400.1 hypothetical protein [Phycisphaerae bacterium]